MLITVKYHAGTYSGKRSVNAEDDEDAIAKVRAWVSKQMLSPMYSASYKVVDNNEKEEEEED